MKWNNILCVCVKWTTERSSVGASSLLCNNEFIELMIISFVVVVVVGQENEYPPEWIVFKKLNVLIRILFIYL